MSSFGASVLVINAGATTSVDLLSPVERVPGNLYRCVVTALSGSIVVFEGEVGSFINATSWSSMTSGSLGGVIVPEGETREIYYRLTTPGVSVRAFSAESSGFSKLTYVAGAM